MLVAPLGDLKECIMSAGRDHTLRIYSLITARIREEDRLFPAKSVIHSVRNPCSSCSADNGIHFGNLFKDFFPVALCHAPCHNKDLKTSLRLEIRKGKDLLNRFLLGILYETAGIDNGCVRFRLIIRDLIPAGGQNPQHFLGIDKILVASE